MSRRHEGVLLRRCRRRRGRAWRAHIASGARDHSRPAAAAGGCGRRSLCRSDPAQAPRRRPACRISLPPASLQLPPKLMKTDRCPKLMETDRCRPRGLEAGLLAWSRPTRARVCRSKVELTWAGPRRRLGAGEDVHSRSRERVFCASFRCMETLIKKQSCRSMPGHNGSSSARPSDSAIRFRWNGLTRRAIRSAGSVLPVHPCISARKLGPSALCHCPPMPFRSFNLQQMRQEVWS